MGWGGPANPRPHRLGPLMAVAVSVLICGPGVPWNAVVFAHTTEQVTAGASRQSTHNSSFSASLPSSVGLPGSATPTRSLSTRQSSTEATLEVDSGPTGASLPQGISVGVTTGKEGIPAFTFPAKTTASPTSLGQGTTTQSLAMMYSTLPESTSREIANSEQRTSSSLRPQAGETPSRNSSTKRTVPEFSSLRTSSTEGTLAGEASTDTHTAETTNGQLTGSTGAEHTSPGVEPGLAKTPPGSLISSESKREPPWTSTSLLSEAPTNRGLPAGGTETAETTTTATVTTRVSTSTVEMLTVLGTQGEVTTKIRSSEEEASKRFRISTKSQNRLDTTDSWTNHLETDASSIVRTSNVSPGDTDAITRWTRDNIVTGPPSWDGGQLRCSNFKCLHC
ncbi:uncharacterized protein RBU33_029549 [Hipposideros larvatus]